MKLQVNQKGSWRDVVSFPDTRETFMSVAEAAQPLARAIGERTSWRIIDSVGAVLGYCDAPAFEWRKP